MANTFIKIYLHIVFAVKYRDCSIPPIHETTIHKYIWGIIKNNGHFPIQIGGTANHIHILLSYENLSQTISDLIKAIKAYSSKYINEQRFIKCKFGWQRGYACMSYSPSHINPLKLYINNQHTHHHNMTLEEEIRNMLMRFDIPFDEKYLIKED